MSKQNWRIRNSSVSKGNKAQVIKDPYYNWEWSFPIRAKSGISTSHALLLVSTQSVSTSRSSHNCGNSQPHFRNWSQAPTSATTVGIFSHTSECSHVCHSCENFQPLFCLLSKNSHFLPFSNRIRALFLFFSKKGVSPVSHGLKGSLICLFSSFLSFNPF